MNKNKKCFEEKFCNDCLILLNENNSSKYNIDHSQYVCIECQKQRDKRRYQDRKEIIREKQRIYDLNVKIKIIDAYGGKCVCCNENTVEFLTIDHINNDDIEDRKKNENKTGGKLYRWLIKNNFPKGDYQILCFNCNYAKSFFGYCPHNKPEIVISLIKRKSDLDRI